MPPSGEGSERQEGMTKESCGFCQWNSLLERLRHAVRIVMDRFIDLWLNIDTSAGYIYSKEPSRFGDPNANIPISYLLLRKYVGRARIDAQDVFYDIGCGYGRALCFVARKCVSKCVGIELSQELAAKARKNATTLRGRFSPIEVRPGDAAEQDYTDGTIFFLFNPFGRETLRTVLTRIESTLRMNPRSVRFIYVNPVHKEVFDSALWLTYCGKSKSFFSPLRVEYWRNIDRQPRVRGERGKVGGKRLEAKG